MSGFLDKLNLRPHEQRLVVVLATIVFLVLNAFFVWPHFGDWKRVQSNLEKSRKTLETYESELARQPRLQGQLRELEAQGGSGVLPSEQVLDLMRTIQAQAQATQITISGTRPTPAAGTSTNQFFDEQIVAVDVTGSDQQLIDFLSALGSDDSMIRVRDMDLRPDPPQYKLIARITLVASYQKSAKSPPAATPNPPARAGSPAATPISPPPGNTNPVATAKAKS